MSAYTVKASCWKHGWELVVFDAAGEEVAITQSHSLEDAGGMVRDCLVALEYPEPTAVVIEVLDQAP